MNKSKKITTQSKTFIVIAAFAVIGIILLAATRAGSTNNSVFFDAETNANQKNDVAAYGGSFTEFSGDGGASGVVQPRSSFPVRNTAFDTQQYQDLPASQIPTDLSNSFLTSGGWGVGAVDREWGRFAPIGNFRNISSFRTWCSFSHLSYDDPIVFPGQNNAAHLHMFFGNTVADENSTGQSLIDNGGSTCDGGPLNRTAYWIPAMMDGNGNAVIPKWLFVYYKAFDAQSKASPLPTASEAFPVGLSYLSKGEGSPPDIDYWCGDVHGNVQPSKHQQTIPNCNGLITQRIRFPFCWDGRTSSDDNSHMVMPIGLYEAGVCPSTHQRRVPHIEYQLEYRGNTANWHLSSDVDPVTNQKVHADGSTGHGDWFNGWNPTINKFWNETCQRGNMDCAQNGYRRASNGSVALRAKWHNRNMQNVAAGQNLISKAQINSLCPGDNDSGPFDGAHCSSAIQANAAIAASSAQDNLETSVSENAINQEVQNNIDRIEDSFIGPVAPVESDFFCTEELVDGACVNLIENN